MPPDTPVFSPAVGKSWPAMRLFIFVCLFSLFLLLLRVMTSVCIGLVIVVWFLGGMDHWRGRSPTISHVFSQHCGQVGQSQSVSLSAPRGRVAPHKHRIGAPNGTLRSR